MIGKSMTHPLIVIAASFIVGAAFTYAVLQGKRATDFTYEQASLEGHKTSFELLTKTAHWDVLTPTKSNGRGVALGQNGAVRVVVFDDGPSLYVLTYKDKNSRIYDGRLMDIGNDGTIEVANITGKQCEQDKK